MDPPEGVEVFPLPTLLLFFGYTLILILDKVLFDTHSLFDHDHEHGGDIQHDPAAKKLQDGIRRSFANAERTAEMTGDPAAVRKSQAKARDEMQQEMKAYLNPHDRFANRMKASLTKKEGADVDDQGMTDETK